MKTFILLFALLFASCDRGNPVQVPSDQVFNIIQAKAWSKQVKDSVYDWYSMGQYRNLANPMIDDDQEIVVDFGRDDATLIATEIRKLDRMLRPLGYQTIVVFPPPYPIDHAPTARIVAIVHQPHFY